MAGKPRHNDEYTNTALLLVEQEKLVEDAARRQQEERERLITQCSKAIGQIQASNMFAKFAAVTRQRGCAPPSSHQRDFFPKESEAFRRRAMPI